MPGKPGKIVTLARFNNAMEAALARNQLADAGIPAMLSGDESGGLFAGMGGAFGTVHLQVAQEYYDRALDVLEGIDEEEAKARREDASTAIKEAGTRELPSEEKSDENSDKLERKKENRNGKHRDKLQSSLPQTPAPAKKKRRKKEDDEDEGNDLQIEWTADDFAARAWRAAVFGCIILPVLLHLYSVWLLIRLATHSGELSSAGTRRMYGALLIDGVVLGGLLFVLRRM